MAKSITRIVLTGGPAAGKTTLISRILREFKQEDDWKVITIPETATELISGFGIKPFGNCVSMEDFQYFVISDQLHKEKLALKAAEMVPENRVLIIYDRAIFDDKAYISDEQFTKTLAFFGKTAEEILAGYDAVLHLVTCAKGAEQAYNYGNAARYESIEEARRKDDLTLEAWSAHPSVSIIDNSVDFEDKINRAVTEIYRILGHAVPERKKHKYLVAMPDIKLLESKYSAKRIEMTQTYLVSPRVGIERRIRQRAVQNGYLYYYTEKRKAEDGTVWVTEKPLAEKAYIALLMEADPSLHAVKKHKYRFAYGSRTMELDVYPFDDSKAILFAFGAEDGELPPELEVLKELTGDPYYKNRALADRREL